MIKAQIQKLVKNEKDIIYLSLILELIPHLIIWHNKLKCIVNK